MSNAAHEARLPVEQLTILAIARFAEPVALTNVNPYLPEMIESFGVPQDEVARWAGLTSAAFSVAQCCTAIAWVRASERFGRKRVIMTSLLCTMSTTLLLGFSQNLTWAIIARALGGAANGNVGIIRTTVAELVPQKALQPRAFSVMPLVWSIGSVFGPMLGGSLASPARNFPDLFGKSEFFIKYPFALPNLVASTLFVTGVLTGILFLKETLASRKNDRDLGLAAGQFLKSFFRRNKDRRTSWTKDIDQASPLLKNTAKSIAPPPKASYRQVFSYQSSMNLLVYFLLSLHAVASDQLVPVFLHLPHEHHDGSTESEGIPIHFNNGFGLDSGHIGRIFTIYGVLTMIIQFSIFPPLARKYGILPCLRACTFMFPISYALMPFTVLMPTSTSRQVAMFWVMAIKGLAGVFAYPCNTVLMTNSASSIPILNTLNGCAVSISAIGRALGPWIGGMAFSFGVETGWGILPWWILAGFAVLGHVVTWFLVEGEGIKEATEESEPPTPSDTLLGEEDEIELLEHEAKEQREEELELLAEDDIDSGTAAQVVAVGPYHSHGHKRGKLSVAEHGDDPELALEEHRLREKEDHIAPRSSRERPQTTRSVSATGSTLVAPATKTRLRSPHRKGSDS